MSTGYSLGLRLCHWITAVLVFAQVSLALLNTLLSEARPGLAELLVQAHISLGAVIFILTVVRIVARLFSPVPVRSHRRTLRLGAIGVHFLLYACLLTLPISGYLKLAWLAFDVTLFGTTILPVLTLNVSLAASAAAVHDVTALILAVLLLLHVAAALLHRHFDGQSVLAHMALGIGLCPVAISGFSNCGFGERVRISNVDCGFIPPITSPSAVTHPPVHQRFDLANGRLAHEALVQRRSIGALILTANTSTQNGDHL